MQSCPREYALFTTITCLEWKPLLAEDRFKDIVIDSLRFLVNENRVIVYAFAIMSNHLHLLWQMVGEHTRENVQRDFLKFTAIQSLHILRNEAPPWLGELNVAARDRKYQFWERNSLSIPLWSRKVIFQKLRYIHENPVRAGLCKKEELYPYSSAAFYYLKSSRWDFLTHVEG